jgi:TetR/AcrR family transcriptional repressor of nem operon
MARTREFDTAAVVERAMHLFWARGYAATSIEALSTELGLGRQSLYGAFGSKEGLYQAALVHYRATMASEMLATLQEPGDIRDAVRAMFAGRLSLATANPERLGCLMVNATAERVPGDPETTRVAGDLMVEGRRALTDALSAAVAAGQISPRRSPEAIARFLMTLMNGLLISAKLEPDRDALATVVELALEVLD